MVTALYHPVLTWVVYRFPNILQWCLEVVTMPATTRTSTLWPSQISSNMAVIVRISYISVPQHRILRTLEPSLFPWTTPSLCTINQW
jgi:hypothetical protein